MADVGRRRPAHSPCASQGLKSLLCAGVFILPRFRTHGLDHLWVLYAWVAAVTCHAGSMNMFWCFPCSWMLFEIFWIRRLEHSSIFGVYCCVGIFHYLYEHLHRKLFFSWACVFSIIVAIQVVIFVSCSTPSLPGHGKHHPFAIDIDPSGNHMRRLLRVCVSCWPHSYPCSILFLGWADLDVHRNFVARHWHWRG